MSLNNSWLGAIILALVTASSCAYVTEKYEYTIQVKRQLSRAGALEDSKNYAEAAKEYGMIAENYPDSFYHRKAVRKAAMLHIHPDNPRFDLDVSLRWFKALAELPISPTEMERVRFYIALLEQIRSLQHDVQKLLAASDKQTRELVERDRQIQLLESEISRIREELRKMKEVDVLLHKSRSKD